MSTHAELSSLAPLNPESALLSLVTSHAAATEFLSKAACTKSRSIFRIREEDIPYNLTISTLAGEDMLSCPPHVFTNDEAGSLLAYYHLGRKLAGHSGIVHGGMMATLLDDCMGRACFPRLSGRIGVTVKLEIEYKSPVPVNSFIVITATTREVQGRKAWVDAKVEDAKDGRVVATATALFVEPKWAAEMPTIL